MVRMSKPALVDPATAHEQHDLSRRGIARIKSLRQQVEDNSRQKALGGKPPYLSGTWLDAEAGPRLARTMHEAGLIIDETTLGDFSPAIAAAQSATQYPYLWSNQTTMADPGNGGVRANNATPTSATELALSLYDRNNVGRPVFAQLAGGDEVAMYVAGDLATWVKFTLDAAPTVTANSWVQMAVTYVDQGSDGFAPLNNADIDVVIRTTAAGDALTPAEGDARYVNVSGDTMRGGLNVQMDGAALWLRTAAGAWVLSANTDLTPEIRIRAGADFAAYAGNDSTAVFRLDGSNGQLYGGGTVPTITPQAGLGSGATASILWGNGTWMYVVLNGGSGAVAGLVAQITFAYPRANTNYQGWLVPANTNAGNAGGQFYTGAASTTQLNISFRFAAAAAAYHFALFVAGMGA